MPRVRRARRGSLASYALSPCSLAGRFGPPKFAARADDGQDGVDQGQEVRGIVGVGRREADDERDAGPIHHEVVFRAGFAPIDRVGADHLAPLFA